MNDVITILVLIILVPLLAWMSYQRIRSIGDDAEKLMRNILGGYPGDIEKRNAPRAYAKVDDRLYSSLIRHFARLNAAEKSLRVIAESPVPMSSNAISAAVNAMQKAEGKNGIPQPIMQLVLDGLQVGGLLVLREGLHEVSTEGKLLNDFVSQGIAKAPQPPPPPSNP